jgi:predicted aldo/keto reductase-like oxidoreductase
LETVELVKRVLRNSLKINCSTCGYCMPCPQGVNIPECMKIYNEKYLFEHKGLFNQSFMDYYQYVGGIMGNEGNGISAATEQMVTDKLFIPNYPEGCPTSESVNVAIASAITCAEFRRRI